MENMEMRHHYFVNWKYRDELRLRSLNVVLEFDSEQVSADSIYMNIVKKISEKADVLFEHVIIDQIFKL